METYTTFSNIDNTVVEIDEKKVQSVADVFRAPLVKFYEDYIEELADELG